MSLEELRASARGWHGVQLAVIGFIGLCGVLKGGRPDNPMWLQVLAVLLIFVALALACAATYLVARVAWPLYGARHEIGDEAAEVARAGRRIKQGLVLTFTAVAVLAVATASGWWPQPVEDGGGAGGAEVTVEARSGERLCGTLGQASPGSVSLEVDGRPVVVALDNVAAIGSGPC
jgi:hypothetical protein